MKTKFKSLLVLPFFALLLFTSCQDEVIEITEPTEAEAIVANSELSNLIEATATFDGSSDNIIDGASCLSIELPVTVVVNGLEIIIDSEEDYDVIEDIFDEFQDDDDSLEIIFPVTIILSDHSTIEINNQEELNTFIESCTPEGEEDDDIECIDFVYPFSVSVFNDEFEVIDVISIDNDRELFRLIREVRDGLRASINYPINLELADGTQVQVNNNAELVNTIRSVRADCDEDDDDDFNDDDFTKEQLDELLVSCPWVVNEVIRNEDDVTVELREYVINFLENGTARVRTRNGDVFNGAWETRVTDRGALIRLEFETFTVFNIEWFVYDIGRGRIKLFAEGGNRVILTKNCNLVIDQSIERIENILQECLWRVTRLNIEGSDNEADFIGTPLLFESEGVVKLRVNGEFLTGTWEVVESNGVFGLRINLIDRPNLQLEWVITLLQENKIYLENNNNSLVIRRFCEDDQDEDRVFIKNVLTEGEWEVALYENDDVNQTDVFNGYVIDFSMNGNVLAEGNGQLINGSWLVFRNDDGYLKLPLNFESEQPFNELNNRWRIAGINENRIELKDINAQGYVERVLVLERL